MQEIEIKGLDEKIFYDVCDNGLPVYMWVNERVNSFYITLSVKYGSIHTEFKKDKSSKTIKVPSGIAHFMEHVKFNEKDGKTANDFFDKLGSDINAFTTFEYTNYQVYANNYFNENLNHLLDYVMTPYFTKSLIAKEKNIIVEEAKMGKDNPYNQLYFGMYNNLFHSYKYKTEVIGKVEDIKKTTLSDIKLVFDTFYHPKNMFLVITGNFNPYEAMQIIKDNQKNKKFRPYQNPIYIVKKEKETVVKEYEEIEANIEIPKIKISLKIPKKNFKIKDELQLRIMLSILLNSNFGTSTDFYEELFEKELVTSFSTSREIIEDYVIISLNLESKYPDEVIPILKNKLNNLEVSEETLKRRIKANIATLVLNYDSIDSVNEDIQDDLIIYGKIIDDPKERYASITLDDMNALLKAINTKEMATVVMLPKQKVEE
ncbi:MAG: insulinase family protein [Bacilli bacterium]|nr:insulinase family protein [Bacilli bacterium]